MKISGLNKSGAQGTVIVSKINQSVCLKRAEGHE
jgi:hypothetical protein